MVNHKETFMKEALKEAKKAYKKLEIPVGAVIVKDGEIIAIHTNTVEGHIDDFEPLSQDEQSILAEIFDNYLDKLTEKNPLGCSGC